MLREARLFGSEHGDGWVLGFGFQDSGFEFRVSGFGVRGSRFGSRDSCFGFRVSGFGIRVSGFGYLEALQFQNNYIAEM